MEFETLQSLATELADNLRLLENNLRDTSDILYSKENKCEGTILLQNLCERWKRVCEKLAEANQSDEVEIQEISEEWEITEIDFHSLEEKQKEYENYLLQNSLLLAEPDEPDNDCIPHLLGSLEISESCESPASNRFSIAHLEKITVHSTPDLSGENMTYLEDTMSELQSRKDTRKTFCVQK